MSVPSYADESTDTMGGYSVEGIPNTHQVDLNAGYFDLSEQPGEKDQLKVKLVNNSDKDKSLKVTVTNGNTNSNGIVDYTGDSKDHSSLKTPLTSILKATQDTVTVPKHSEVETTLELSMPKEKFEGIILGGIVISDDTESNKKSDGMSMGNIYNYTLGVVIRNNAKTEVYKNVSVELETIETKLDYGKKVVQVNFLNPNPYILGEATVEGKILDEESGKVLQEQAKDKVVIAPNSVYPFQFDWQKEEIKPGNYVFEGVVKTKDQEWKFSHKFSIEEETAKELNEKTAFKVHIPNWLKMASIVLFVLMISFTIWAVIKKKKG